MNEFIEKLIGRLEELNQSQIEKYTECLCEENLACIYDKTDIEETKVKATYEIIQIVNQLAEEHKGGWISVKERLPRQNEEVLATILLKGKPMVLIINYDHTWLDDGLNKLIAWQPLPKPYQQKEGAE